MFVRALAASGGGAHCLSAIRPHSANSLSTSKVALDRESNQNDLTRTTKVFKSSLNSAASVHCVHTQPIPCSTVNTPLTPSYHKKTLFSFQSKKKSKGNSELQSRLNQLSHSCFVEKYKMRAARFCQFVLLFGIIFFLLSE